MNHKEITVGVIREKLTYPWDEEEILKNCKKWTRLLREKLQAQDETGEVLRKRIAILGGSTTRHIRDVLSLFLLREGISCEFYESDYARFWEEGVFENKALEDFSPDIIYIFTSSRNLMAEMLHDGNPQERLSTLFDHYETLWEALQKRYSCTILQNNFELPFYRLLGNQDEVLPSGGSRLVNELNEHFYEYAVRTRNFYIVDLNYAAAEFGLSRWHDLGAWYLYKYAFSLQAVPLVAWNVSRIIKALCGKNKKGLVLDLDNTLWGGIIGEDGIDYIKIGEGTPVGEAYLEFQRYLKQQAKLGVVLNVCSKNDYEIALDGIHHPENILTEDDFYQIQANWKRKDENISVIAKEINVSADSLVFLDDNPAERELVRQNLPAVETPALDNVENYIKTIDKNHYFEVLDLSKEDLARTAMYKENRQRQKEKERFQNYGDYLTSLEMSAVIHSFQEEELERIYQLIQKSNQFNLTTERYTFSEIQNILGNSQYITLSGRLADKFGDNGIVSLIIAEKDGMTAHIRLWLMSCRVLGRELELAMFDELRRRCREHGIQQLIGYYYPTKKNQMVQDLYSSLGFQGDGADVWKYMLADNEEEKNHYIMIKGED